jgi:hypothetical protein
MPIKLLTKYYISYGFFIFINLNQRSGTARKINDAGLKLTKHKARARKGPGYAR